MKMLEYMACRRAIISSDLPVIREVLNPSNAMLCPAEDIEAWCQALGELILDEARRQALSDQAWQDIQQYTWLERAHKALEGFPYPAESPSQAKSLLMNLRKLSSSPIACLIFVGAVAFLSRLLIILLYQPVAYGDTPSYWRLAETVLQGFTGYDGTRTPGYPVFLALLGSDRNIWLAQLLLGFVTTLLIFFMGWKLLDKPWFGGLLALAHTINLGQLFFESNLLTESLTTFLMILTMAGVLVWLLYPQYRRPWLAFLLGLTSTATLLVRPLFIYLPFYILLFLWIEPKLTQPSQFGHEGDIVVENGPEEVITGDRELL
jgi:hypothetical protein